MNKEINNYLISLSKSKFRNSFHLKSKDLIYINTVGINKIREHAYDFINKRLAPELIENDGHQTPMRNHPVFIAQHATATCCRGCLNKWYKIPKDRRLTDSEIDFIVAIIMQWINNEISKNKTEQNF